MVVISNQMKQDRSRRIAEIESRVDNAIIKAAKNGDTRTYFQCDMDADADVYDEIKHKYQSAGYIIKPTGYISGIWQRTESICW